MPLTPERLQDAYRQMLVIRQFEETIRSLYQQGRIRGSLHPCVGQEATAVGGCWAIRKDDHMTCTYRGHGQAIAKGLSVRAAMAEMLISPPATASLRALRTPWRQRAPSVRLAWPR